MNSSGPTRLTLEALLVDSAIRLRCVLGGELFEQLMAVSEAENN